MITHDCLNVIIKNFALILIALLYLTKYISKKIDNNLFFSLSHCFLSHFLEQHLRLFSSRRQPPLLVKKLMIMSF